MAIAAVGAYVGAQVIANVTSVKIGSTKGAVSALSLPLIYLSPDRDWRADPEDA